MELIIMSKILHIFSSEWDPELCSLFAELMQWLNQNVLLKHDHSLALDVTTFLHLSQLCFPVMLDSRQTIVEYESVQFTTLWNR